MLTGFNLTTYTPNVNVDTGSDEYQRNYIEVQHQIIVEDFFTFATALGKYNYARGCAWGYGPDVWNADKQKRINCWKKSFDCWWVIKAFAAIKGIFTKKEVGRNNSATLYDMGQPIAPEMAQRGDYTFRQLVSWSGLASTHGAVVVDALSWGRITIFDWLKGKFEERDLVLHCSKTSCIYNTNNGKYRIKFSTNPLYEVAMEKWVTVEPFVQTTGTTADIASVTGAVSTYGICVADDSNPLGYRITIDWYAYDSIANRTANRWYVRNHSKDMIATYLCENWGFKADAESQTRDSWLCQLNRWVSSNMYWINNPKRKEFDFQRQTCLDKRNLVQDHNAIRACYKTRKIQMARIKDMSWAFRWISDE